MMPKPKELAIMVDVFLAGYYARHPDRQLDPTLSRVAAAETIAERVSRR